MLGRSRLHDEVNATLLTHSLTLLPCFETMTLKTTFGFGSGWDAEIQFARPNLRGPTRILTSETRVFGTIQLGALG